MDDDHRSAGRADRRGGLADQLVIDSVVAARLAADLRCLARAGCLRSARQRVPHDGHADSLQCLRAREIALRHPGVVADARLCINM